MTDLSRHYRRRTKRLSRHHIAARQAGNSRRMRAISQAYARLTNGAVL